MTPQERLKLYETALIDWTASLEMSEYQKISNHVFHGLCDYFDSKHSVYLYVSDEIFNNILPELYAQNPHNNKMFWFPIGDTQSRITCLENAIKLTKETYNL
jgi:hypothetical protein